MCVVSVYVEINSLTGWATKNANKSVFDNGRKSKASAHSSRRVMKNGFVGERGGREGEKFAGLDAISLRMRCDVLFCVA